VIELGFDFGAMASPCELRLQGNDEAQLQRAAAAAIDEVRRIEKKYSRYDESSIVSRVNAAAGSGLSIEIDDETSALLEFAARLHDLSEGLFDVTSGVLRRVWNFRQPRVPAQGEIDALLPVIGWSKVRRDGRRIALPHAGMEIDFGGFGKEYAADRAAEVLTREGVEHGFVNLGGDIRVVGPRSYGDGWRLGIRHPRRADALIHSVELGSGGLATSGDYERFFEVDGRRYCHLLDPRSGWPISYWQSVSVIAPTCAAAGAACTIAALRQQDGPSFLREQGLASVFVGSSGDVLTDLGDDR
jgi:thiamine biosynthesis lipoprotein